MNSSADERAIRQLYAAWFGAMEAGDSFALTALLTQDVMLKMPSSAPMFGREAVARALSDFHASFTERVEFVVEEVEVVADLAYARISETATIRLRAGGDPVAVRGTHLAILKRQADSTWLVARDVSSLDSQP